MIIPTPHTSAVTVNIFDSAGIYSSGGLDIIPSGFDIEDAGWGVYYIGKGTKVPIRIEHYLIQHIDTSKIGFYSVKIAAFYGEEIYICERGITVTDIPLDLSPRIDKSVSIDEGYADTDYSFTVPCKSISATTYELDLSLPDYNFPDCLELDPQRGVISGKAEDEDIGVYNFGVKAFNEYGEDSVEYTLYIYRKEPEIFTHSLPEATVGEEYFMKIDAKGAPPLELSCQYLPSGLRFDPITHCITGVPTEDGEYSVEVLAKNFFGFKTKVYTLKVNPIAEELQIITESLNQAYLSEYYDAPDMAAKGGIEPYRWAAAGLPDGLFIYPTGSLAGLPESNTIGIYHVAFLVTDAVGNACNKGLMLIVRPDHNPTIYTEALPYIPPNGEYFTPIVAYGDHEIGFVLNGEESDALPAGLDLIPETGVIQGTCTEESGCWNIVIEAYEYQGGPSTSKSYQLYKAPYFDAEYYEETSLAPFVKRISSIPSGSAKRIGWSLEADPAGGDYPDGLRVDGEGVLAWEHPTIGEYQFYVKGTMDGHDHEELFHLNIIPANNSELNNESPKKKKQRKSVSKKLKDKCIGLIL